LSGTSSTISTTSLLARSSVRWFSRAGGFIERFLQYWHHGFKLKLACQLGHGCDKVALSGCALAMASA
jgi:hypothetical protein